MVRIKSQAQQWIPDAGCRNRCLIRRMQELDLCIMSIHIWPTHQGREEKDIGAL